MVLECSPGSLGAFCESGKEQRAAQAVDHREGWKEEYTIIFCASQEGTQPAGMRVKFGDFTC